MRHVPAIVYQVFPRRELEAVLAGDKRPTLLDRAEARRIAESMTARPGAVAYCLAQLDARPSKDRIYVAAARGKSDCIIRRIRTNR